MASFGQMPVLADEQQRYARGLATREDNDSHYDEARRSRTVQRYAQGYLGRCAYLREYERCLKAHVLLQKRFRGFMVRIWFARESAARMWQRAIRIHAAGHPWTLQALQEYTITRIFTLAMKAPPAAGEEDYIPETPTIRLHMAGVESAFGS